MFKGVDAKISGASGNGQKFSRGGIKKKRGIPDILGWLIRFL